MLTDEQRKERTIKYLNKEVELFTYFYAHKCKVSLTYKELDDVEDNNSNKLWAIEFDSITIISNADMDEFEVGYESYIPGSYWEPESGDYLEYSKHDNINDALFDVVKIMLDWEYHNFLESQYAEECIGELYDEEL
jgi:hypothetical protein